MNTSAIFRALHNKISDFDISRMRMTFGLSGIGGLVMCGTVNEIMTKTKFKSESEEIEVGYLLQNLCQNHFNRAAKEKRSQDALKVFGEMTKNLR